MTSIRHDGETIFSHSTNPSAFLKPRVYCRALKHQPGNTARRFKQCCTLTQPFLKLFLQQLLLGKKNVFSILIYNALDVFLKSRKCKDFQIPFPCWEKNRTYSTIPSFSHQEVPSGKLLRASVLFLKSSTLAKQETATFQLPRVWYQGKKELCP